MAKDKYVMKNPERLEDILNRYNPVVDCGAMGKRADVLVRKAITAKIERAHPAGIADCKVKRGVSVEVKTGAGELDPFGYDTKEEAMEAMEAGEYLKGCTHVAYLAKFDGHNLEDFIVTSKKRFIKILLTYNLVRVKHSTDGKWKITIQNFLPTPNFHPSKEKAGCFFEALEENGLYIDLFCEKMTGRELDI